jgi:hypothetical protein
MVAGFLPQFSHYRTLLFDAANLTLLIWYFVISNRIIGKLAMRDALGGWSIQVPPKSGYSPAMWSLFIVITLLPVGALMGGLGGGGLHAFIVGLLAFEGVCCLFLAFTLMTLAYIIYFVSRSNPLANYLLGVGINLAIWFVVAMLAFAAVRGK